MSSIHIAAVVVTLTATLGYINGRFLKLPSGIGMMTTALLGSVAVLALDGLGVIDSAQVERLVAQANFSHTLLHGLLGLLLFAGALQLDVSELHEQKWPVAMLSLGGTIASTAIVGFAMYAVLGATGNHVPLLDAMLFGALISPTDPVAVLQVLKFSRVPRALATQISGESLFNDGVGVVLFSVVLALSGGETVSAGGVLWLFVKVAFGGAALGFALGFIASHMLRTSRGFSVEVSITLALVLGGYALAEAMEVSAPIAAIVAGLVVGKRHGAREQLAAFWELVDDVLNAVLFLLLGLQITRLELSREIAIASAMAVPVVLGARVASVAASVIAVRPFVGKAAEHAIAILTWGGIRGGLAVALALSLPPGPHRDAIVAMAYVVVCFAILVQGLTLQRLLKRLGVAD